jgi:nucleoside-diphosphate-sugar epimerase
VRGDIRDTVKLFETIKTYAISHIMHLAAYLPEAAIRKNPTLAIQINGEGTNNIFETARIMGVERVVYATTDAVNPLGPKEDSPCSPTTLYGHLKRLNEVMGNHFHNEFGLDTIGLRFGMNYGARGRLMAGELEREYASAVVLDVVERVAVGDSVVIPFHESTSFHWVYADDNVRAMTLALTAPKTERRVFNVCGEEPYTLGDMAAVLKTLRPTADIQFGDVPMPPTMKTAEALKMDCSAAYEELGYRPEYTLERGLKAYVNRCALR